jgi:hypothetical protein
MKVPGKAALAGVMVIGLALSTGAASHEPAGQAARPTPTATSANAAGAATKAFIDRMNEYVSFHNNVQKMVPPLKETPNPEQIAQREKALADQLIKSRPNARQGDFFIKQYQPYLVQIIKDDFSKRPLVDRKALIQELPKGMKIAVNMAYPTTIALATFPANLLKKLPELPEELEYRIVGRHLILRDAKANVIVDYMPDVFPIPM